MPSGEVALVVRLINMWRAGRHAQNVAALTLTSAVKQSKVHLCETIDLAE